MGTSYRMQPREKVVWDHKPEFGPKTMDGTYESSFDIIKFTESNYRVKADKANRAIVGLSMGFHTMHISDTTPILLITWIVFCGIDAKEDATEKYTPI